MQRGSSTLNPGLHRSSETNTLRQPAQPQKQTAVHGGRLLLNLIQKYFRRKTEPIRLLQRLAPVDLTLQKLVHVGAHLAQERSLYEDCGYQQVLWIEGSPDVFQRLSKVLHSHQGSAQHHSLCALLTDKDGDEIALKTFSNDGKSNSIFSPTSEMASRWPSVTQTGKTESVSTRTLDSVLAESPLAGHCDVLIVDVQGAELLVLRGAEKTLANAKAVIAEVSTRPYYQGGVLFPELKAFLESRGFTAMSLPRRHGDMLFLRNEYLVRSKSA
jgi:FkbM family methyltransferase